jgi:hypothetical protein
VTGSSNDSDKDIVATLALYVRFVGHGHSRRLTNVCRGDDD